MNYEQLFEQIRKKRSFLIIGLDTDTKKIPKGMTQFEFNKAIIDATHDLSVGYKPNLAFYEAEGSEGWINLEKTVWYIKTHYPELFVIADAKRGDIGNTSSLYARAFFEKLNVDAVTVAPYMGEDSVKPFLEEYKLLQKWVILLALTSNKGSDDFQTLITGSLYPLYEEVLKKSQKWGTTNNMMYVIGATKAEKLTEIRQLVPDHFLLVPGVGAQGGSLEQVAHYGMNHHCGLLVNSSREIIYASNDKDFAKSAAKIAYEKYQQTMEMILREKGLI